MSSADLDRVLANIDTLLPPGAPTTPAGACEPWEAEAMRWSPVDHDDHPDLPAPPPVDYWAREPWPAPDPQDSALTAARGITDLFQQLVTWVDVERVPPVGQGTPNRAGVVIEQAARYSGSSESLMRAAIQATADAYQAQLESLRGQAQHTTRNLQHLRNRHQQAQAVINARRHRNTGPQNPAGIDGRPRRHQHPTKAPADNARPATQGAATPIVWMREQDGAPVVVSFDPAWQ